MRKIIVCLCVCFSLVLSVSAATNNTYKGKNPKYVFLFIGDGMSMVQVASAEMYLAANNSNPDMKKLSFTQFDSQGLTTTYDAGSLITDSASAITAIATGNKTLSGVLNMDVAKKQKYKTIAEYIKDKGMKIGIVTSVSLDHATPAGFYAHQPSRNNMYEIGGELAVSGFDYFGGGGFVKPTGSKNDQKSIFDTMKENGYKVVTTVDDFNKIKNGDKVVAVNQVLFDSNAMNYEVDRTKGELSLADFTKKGIEVLDNKKGFFLAVEGGKIDWACHANDAMSSIKDTIAFDESVKVAVDFMKKYPNDTLIIVTGDHETGGMSVGFAGTGYSTFFKKLDGQKTSYVKFDSIISDMKKEGKISKIEDVLPIIKENFGLNRDDAKSDLYLSDYEFGLLKDAFAISQTEKTARPKDDATNLNYGSYDPLSVTITHILNRKAGIGWTSYSHTAVPVPTYASGVGSQLFDGYYDNTDIFFKLKSIIGIK